MELNNRLLDVQEVFCQKNEEFFVVMMLREVEEIGIYFKIQIGVYEKIYIFENLVGDDMGLELDGLLQKVLVGKFNDY